MADMEDYIQIDSEDEEYGEYLVEYRTRPQLRRKGCALADQVTSDDEMKGHSTKKRKTSTNKNLPIDKKTSESSKDSTNKPSLKHDRSPDHGVDDTDGDAEDGNSDAELPDAGELTMSHLLIATNVSSPA